MVGIIEKTLTAPDNSAIVPLPDAQELVHATLPDAFQKSITPDQIVSDFAVYLTDISQATDVAKRIEEQVGQCVTRQMSGGLEASRVVSRSSCSTTASR